MKQGLKYAVLALGPIVLIAGILWSISGGNDGVASSMTYYNVITGETEKISTGTAGVSVRFDDDGRQSMFVIVDADGELASGSDESVFIRDRDRSVFDKLVAEGKLSLDEVKVDPDTYQIRK